MTTCVGVTHVLSQFGPCLRPNIQGLQVKSKVYTLGSRVRYKADPSFLSTGVMSWVRLNSCDRWQEVSSVVNGAFPGQSSSSACCVEKPKRWPTSHKHTWSA